MTASRSATLVPLIDRLDQLFAGEGFAHFTVGKLAACLGCSRRALYELAPSKDDLLEKVIKQNYQLHLDDAKAAIYAHLEPLDRLTAFFDVIRERNERQTDRFVVDVIATPSTNNVRLKHISQMLDLLEGILRDGVAKDVFRPQDPQLVTALAFGLLQTVDSLEITTRLGNRYADLFVQAIDLFLNGVLAHYNSALAERRISLI